MRLVFVMIALITLSGCGWLKKSGQALRKGSDVSPEAVIGTWQGQILKTCSASEAAGDSDSSEDAAKIDLQVLLKRTNGSRYFTDATGRHYVLRSYAAPHGFAESTYQSDVEINGKGTSVQVAAKGNGGHCEVSVAGDVAYVTELADHLEVQVLFDPMMPIEQRKVKSNEPAAKPWHRALSVDGYNLLRLSSAFSQTDALPFATIAELFAISEDEAKRLIRGSNDSVMEESVASVMVGDDAVSFSATTREIIANTPVTFYGWQKGEEFAVDVRTKLGAIGDGVNVWNPVDSELLSMTYGVKWEQAADKNWHVHVQSFQLNERKALSAAEYKTCFLPRLKVMQQAMAASESYPEFNNVSGPCEVLVEDSLAALFADAELRLSLAMRFQQISLHLGGVTPQYNGWDFPLREFVKHCALTKDEIKDCVAADAPSAVVNLIQEYYSDLRKTIPLEKEFGHKNHLASSLAFSWGVNHRNVTSARIERAAAAIMSLGENLKTAEFSLVLFVGHKIDEADEVIEFALTRDDAYRSAFKAIEDKIEGSKFANTVRDRVLAKAIVDRISIEKLNETLGSVEAISQFVKEETERSSEEGFSHEQAMQTFVDRALQEAWGADEFKLVTQFSQLADARPYCAAMKTVSRRVDCLGLSSGMLSRAKGGFLDPAFANRYGGIVEDFAGYHKTLKAESDMLRYELENAFPATVIWKSCSNEAFEANRNTLKQKMAAYLATVSYKRYPMRNEIESLLLQCR